MIGDIQPPRSGDEILPWAIDITQRANRKITGQMVVPHAEGWLIREPEERGDPPTGSVEFVAGVITVCSIGSSYYPAHAPYVFSTGFGSGNTTCVQATAADPNFQINQQGLYKVIVIWEVDTIGWEPNGSLIDGINQIKALPTQPTGVYGGTCYVFNPDVPVFHVDLTTIGHTPTGGSFTPDTSYTTCPYQSAPQKFSFIPQISVGHANIGTSFEVAFLAYFKTGAQFSLELVSESSGWQLYSSARVIFQLLDGEWTPPA